MKVNLQVEAQRGLNWARWQKFVPAVESLGFDGLFRSDHFVEDNPPDHDSLELWISLTWVAANTKRIQFGSLVSPVSFRHPVHTARMAKDVDDLSDGRFVLGVGAGWGAREHAMFGFHLLDTRERFRRWEEGLEVITRLWRSAEPVNFEGRYFQLRDAVLLPHPRRAGGPPILIGGNGPRRVLEIAARYGDEWNGIFRSPAELRALNAELDTRLRACGREPRAVLRSQMKGMLFGRDSAEVERKLKARQTRDPRTRAELLAWGMLIGTSSEIVEQLGQLSDAGMEQVMIQWLDLDDLDGLTYFAEHVLPQVQPMQAQFE
ncbi:MAG TPA: TIGR03560 family F420-dependent LLM class oxidoreductase [Anaerolineae bacterium]|nr:TIGR03560 family F420-dependent LLM class oxidoreductase [Anaerolineae bacterium]